MTLALSGIVLLALAQDPAPGSAAAELNRAEQADAKADYKTALAVLDALDPQTLPLPERARWHSLRAGALANTGRGDDALRSATEAEALASSPPQPGILAGIAHVRGVVSRNKGAALQAIAHFNDGLRIAEEAGNRRLAASSYSSLAATYQDIGDWSRVLDYAGRAYNAHPNPTDAVKFNYLIQRGIAYYEFNDRDRAEQSFRDALAIAETTANGWSLSVAYGELGMVYHHFDRDWPRALDHFERAIARAREIAVPMLESTWVNNSARVYRDSGRLDEALARYRHALVIERQGGQGRNVPMLLKNIGQAFARQGRIADAEAMLLEARDLADRQGAIRQRWESRTELGRLYAPRDPALAEHYFTESIELIEAAHSNVLLENFRAGALSFQLDQYDPYDLYIELLLNRGDTSRAFEIAERARARAFLDTLSLAREAIGAAVPLQYVQEENAVLRDISTMQVALRGTTLGDTERERTRRELDGLEEKLTALRLRLAVDRPAVAEARFPRLWSIEELQRDVLVRGETLVLFHVGRETSAAWIVSQDAVKLVRLPSRDTIETAVRAYLATIATPAAPADPGAARALAAMLVPELDAIAPDGSRLIVIPHGLLHHVPFEALTDGAGRYWIEKYVISYAPSASSLAYFRRPAAVRARGRNVVAIGNPVAAAATPAEERNFRVDWMNDLRPLPHTAAELRQIGSIFGRRARVLEQAEANEASLAQAIGEAGALHFATHALVDEDQPDRSGLLLSPHGPESDGILQMREIYRMRTPASLVTLSACRTALGRRLAGEGVMGLSRAFFYAGADTVVASLWNVNDAAAAQWMTTFYEAVSRGAPVDEAVREAKLRFLRSDTTLKHPFYWAPFVATGHAATRLEIEAPLSVTTIAFAIATAGLALGLLALVRARAARQRTVAVESGS